MYTYRKSTKLKWQKANKQYNSVQVTIHSSIVAMARDTILKTANLRKQYVMDATRKVILSKHAEQAVSHILRKRLDLCTGQVKILKLIQMFKVIISTLQVNRVENRNKANCVATKVDGVRERPFNLKGGLWFFSKKIF
jgi:hypothetical protein